MIGLIQVTQPAVEPVTLDQAKQFCVIDADFVADDDVLSGFITASRVTAEKYMRRAIFTQRFRLSLDRFPMFWGNSTVKNTTDSYFPYQHFFEGMTIKLPMPRCTNVVSITFFDNTGTQQTIDPANYYVDYDSEPCRIIPTTGNYWPFVGTYQPGAVKVTFDAGTWGDGQTVNTCPGAVSTAVALLTAQLYGNREGMSDIPNAFYRLLDAFRFESFGYFFY
jgi:hypothetical protein